MEDSPFSRRERESILFDRCIGLLQAAQKTGPGTAEALEAVLFTRQLWTFLIGDLGQPQNALPGELKASLISIGFFIVKEIEKLGNGHQIDFNALIEISESIRNGLSAQEMGM